MNFFIMKAQGGCYIDRTVNRIQLRRILPSSPCSHGSYPLSLSCRLLRWVQTHPADSSLNFSYAKSSKHLFLGSGWRWRDIIVFLAVTLGVAGCAKAHGTIDTLCLHLSILPQMLFFHEIVLYVVVSFQSYLPPGPFHQ